jgi:cell shape-determining protein MreD
VAALVLFGIGVFLQLLLGALARFAPGALCPDVTLLFAAALALRVGGARALLAAAGLGYVADLLSGGPLGLSVLLAVLTFALTRLANGSLELRRPLAVAAFVAALTPIVALAGWAVATFFGASLPIAARVAGFVLVRTAVNFLAAPLVDALALAIGARTGDDDLARRGVPLASGRRAG